jgi:hypothetical protein
MRRTYTSLVGTLVLVGLGCAGPRVYAGRGSLDERERDQPEVAHPPAPQLLSAHLARAPDDGPTALLLVFSVEVDPTSLSPRAFVVVRKSGELVVPQRALLDPADEYDENRTVTLLGDFGRPEEDPATAVRIVGNVYGEDGSALNDLDAAVRAFETPDELVWIEILRPDEHRCPGARQVVRTYWSDDLRAVEPADLERVQVSFSDGSHVGPVGFDDHAGLGDEAAEVADGGDDNVLDLCLDRDAPVSAVALPAGVFEDPAGHATAATTRGPTSG